MGLRTRERWGGDGVVIMGDELSCVYKSFFVC